jgi:hypothetical protein
MNTMRYLAMGLVLGSVLTACGPAEVDEQTSADESTVNTPAEADPQVHEMAGCDLPAGCSNHCKAIDVRSRTINKNTYLHEMSLNCVPYGPVDGTMVQGSHFDVYFSDPYEPSWCYGYSVQLARKGYVLCSSLSI